MTQQPFAICDNCGTLFFTGSATGPSLFGPGIGAAGMTIEFRNVHYGPCPSCGGYGSVPDGIYQFRDDALTIFSTWPVERLRALAAALEAARAASDPQSAIQALENEGGLADLVRRIAGKDYRTALAFIAVILSAISTAIAVAEFERGSSVPAKPETIIEKVITEPAPQARTQTAKAAARVAAATEAEAEKALRDDGTELWWDAPPRAPARGALLVSRPNRVAP